MPIDGVVIHSLLSAHCPSAYCILTHTRYQSTLTKGHIPHALQRLLTDVAARHRAIGKRHQQHSPCSACHVSAAWRVACRTHAPPNMAMFAYELPQDSAKSVVPTVLQGFRDSVKTLAECAKPCGSKRSPTVLNEVGRILHEWRCAVRTRRVGR